LNFFEAANSEIIYVDLTVKTVSEKSVCLSLPLKRFTDYFWSVERRISEKEEESSFAELWLEL